MSKEAMKLALEAFEYIEHNYMSLPAPATKAITALREALAKPDFWEGYVPEPDKRQQALDKKAENARELGLDYEPAQQEPVALFKWLPEGATHIGRISVRTSSGGSLAMTAHAFKYDNAVLKVYVTDNDNEYPGWRDAKDCFFHLNFPVLPLYTSPPAQRTWVGLMRGVRVEGDTVVITVKGGNDEARCLWGELISEMEKKT